MNAVARSPSGAKMRVWQKRSSDCPDTVSTSWPSSMKPRSLYTTLVPGGDSSFSRWICSKIHSFASRLPTKFGRPRFCSAATSL